ncbi:indoleamine 2,3-dioxygenase [Aspergillus clavatus NRRL 1]|uniref:Indoleamine 2,3-dioxygenase n=1 Tax=Aspergillus clavatus (strain ATCC 1007 / CBS 513.65 / DSM 816 / NCTC 3887 / NRRL 1 / QM 1276 / 107) TaxID=344612 RepID=A1CHS9_ASPCL|nr:indoleamine 2,3-dioxygenase pyrrole 2,3-dioxygenase) [Aspergillus clavatus NRRL 1]EAW10434.1 indoleamine 2,3-dioxygenase pyrrole 2,3-dioxygenase) [Aspergillus clavatus NRRL 1]
MLNLPEIALDQYGLSSQHAFLPDIPPLQKLQDPYYSSWEEIVNDLPTRIEAGTIRQAVDSLPVLSTSRLQEDADWRRAYVVLAFITHAYIWGGGRPKDVLPPAVSRPFLEVSEYLELPPCATYAALNLWNFKMTSPDLDITDPDNLSVINSFTRTKDEEWFFVISVAIEAKGAELIPLMLNAVYAATIDDSQRVATLLHQLSEGLKELGILLERMYEKCSPPVFFHQLRPFLAGSKNMAAAGLPKGVFYDLGGHGEWHQYSGGSNAQSSLIQTFDIFLGIEHSATGEAKSKGQSKGAVGYIQDMRNYMPGPHRRFLEMLTRISNVRQYAMGHKPNTEVRDAYNTAVMAVGAFRDKHIQMVSRYIITAARTKPTHKSLVEVNLATVTAASQAQRSDEAPAPGYSGTGGTDLIPFLKQTRDTTKAAANYTD